MAESESSQAKVSGLLKNIYRCANKDSWYSNVAEAYDRTRPRYSDQLIAKVKDLVDLQPDKKILEIGCGPGIASLEFAKLGVQVIGLEPSLSACEIARRKCANYANVEFINSTFEDCTLTEKQFDAVIATTSFHWVTPEIRTKKSASILKNNGYLILLWNTPPELNAEARKSLTPAYQAHTLELISTESILDHRQNLAKFGQEIVDSGYFYNLETEAIILNVVYTVEEYLTLLTTLSSYIRLETSVRNNLLEKLRKILKSQYSDRLELSYLSMVQIARKI